MLVLQRYSGESVVVDTRPLAELIDSDPARLREILEGRISILAIDFKRCVTGRTRVRLGISAPNDLPVHRGEVMAAIDRQAELPEKFRQHKVCGLPAEPTTNGSKAAVVRSGRVLLP